MKKKLRLERTICRMRTLCSNYSTIDGCAICVEFCFAGYDDGDDQADDDDYDYGGGGGGYGVCCDVCFSCFASTTIRRASGLDRRQAIW